MEFLLHNEEGIKFPPIRPAYKEGELFFERFRALTPRDSKDSVIGEGGTGLIHLVRDELMDRIVALKLPHESILRDKSARFDVIRETRLAIELTHPHIVRIHDFHEGPEGWGISMQYVRGKNLDEWRHEGRVDSRRGIVPYPVERIESWISQLCDALIYAHEDAGMVHRDIKPKNLMLERREEGYEKLLITDFGITQKLRLHTMMLSRAQPGVTDKNTMGTLPYMPWEQIQGASAVPSDDIYAVGATIYELLTGRPPFYEGGYEQIRTQVEKVVPPSMAARLDEFDLHNHGIPDAWEKTVAKCLSKRQSDRPETVREIVAMLGLASTSKAPLSAPHAPVPDGVIVVNLQKSLQQKDEEIRSLKEAELQNRTEIQTLQQSIDQIQATFDSTELQRRELDAELAALRQDLELAQAEAQRWKSSYDSVESGLNGEQQELAASLQATIGEKDQQLVDLRSKQDALKATLAELESSRANELQIRSKLEAELNAAREAAKAGSAELEGRFRKEMEALRKSAEVAEKAAAAEKQNSAALVRQAEESARKQSEQALAEARKQADAARNEITRLAEETKRAGNLVEQAKSELASLKTRQTAPLQPMLYVLIGALILGAIIGAVSGHFGSEESSAAIASQDLSAFGDSIPDEVGSTRELVSTGLFKAYLREQGIAEADWEKIVPGLSGISDPKSPVTGVSWWVAESFCAWLGVRELDESERSAGHYFRIAKSAEIEKFGRNASSLPEWTSDSGESGTSRKIFGGNEKSGTWQIPSMTSTLDGKQPLAFRLTLDAAKIGNRSQ